MTSWGWELLGGRPVLWVWASSPDVVMWGDMFLLFWAGKEGNDSPEELVPL